MEFRVDHVSYETKWAMAAKGLTGALAAHLDAIYRVVGKEKYAEIIYEIWAEIGQSVAEDVRSSGVATDTAESVAQAAVSACICAMGPEYKIEPVEASADRSIMRITECPWKNRMKESGISHDLLSACDVAFWKHFTENLNPKVKMRHGKQMHRGNAYCEWIFEAKDLGA